MHHAVGEVYLANLKSLIQKVHSNAKTCMVQVKLQHLVTLHVRSSAFGSKLDAGMFMKALSVQYDVWVEDHYQRMLTVSLTVKTIAFLPIMLLPQVCRSLCICSADETDAESALLMPMSM